MTGADGQEPYVNGEEKPRQRRSDALINRLLETHFPTLFYTAGALSTAPRRFFIKGDARKSYASHRSLGAPSP